MADSLNVTVIPRESGLCWTREPDHYPAGCSERINCVSYSMDLHENSHLHRCRICVVMASGLPAVWKGWLQRGLPLSEWWSAAAAAAVVPFLSSGRYYHTCVKSRTHTHTHRRIGRGTEEPHTADAALLRDSIQGRCTDTSKHALCHGPPRKTCLPCRPLRVMCSQSRRSECSYSASQWAPFICPLWPGDTRKWSKRGRENPSEYLRAERGSPGP